MIGETIARDCIVKRLGDGGVGVDNAEDIERENQWTEK
jgi:hypothetical protein